MNTPHRGTTSSDHLAVLECLRLVGALGLTVVALITGCFLGGLWLSREYGLGLFPVVAGVITGVVLSFVWTYQRLVHHLATPASGTRRRAPGGEDGEGTERKWTRS